MPETTLFYSKYCNHCKNFILQLKANNLLTYFKKKICIDDKQIRKNLPPFLKEVPTIITDDYDQPIASDMAFKWISFKIKDLNKQKEEKQQSNRQPNRQSNNQCSPNDLQCYAFGGIFDNAGGLQTENDSLKPVTKNLDNEGKTTESFINYDAFKLIDPNSAGKKGSTGSIDYDAFSLGGGVSNNMSNGNTGGEVQQAKGSFDKDLEKLQKLREMDNNFFGGNGAIRQ